MNIKIAVLGEKGTGKTHFCLSAPGEAVVYDAEGAAGALALANDWNHYTCIYPSADLVTKATQTLEMAMAGDARFAIFSSFVLDSWSVIEDAMHAKQPGSNTPEARDKINSILEHGLLRVLTVATQKHIIVTAHEKGEWTVSGTGQTNLKRGVVRMRRKESRCSRMPSI